MIGKENLPVNKRKSRILQLELRYPYHSCQERWIVPESYTKRKSSEPETIPNSELKLLTVSWPEAKELSSVNILVEFFDSRFKSEGIIDLIVMVLVNSVRVGKFCKFKAVVFEAEEFSHVAHLN